MMKYKQYILAFLISSLIFSCQTTQNEERVSKGNLQLVFGSNGRLQEDINNYGLSIENAEGKVILSFDKISEAPTSIPLAVGEYTVKAFSASEMPYVTFDAPYYYGEESCTIESGKETSVNITCALKHLKLNVNFDSDIINNSKSYSATAATAHADITVDATTSNTVFVERSALLIETVIEQMDGSIIKGKQILSGLEEQTEYTVNISY
ncbi:DUF4493 domain-containing protein [Flammeovirga pacifica]|uniref:DUF4493 domain-containing protein n=1 Tax=Flammeovirga pacifica TaxID=915059 RepID=A0A1S1YU55_FLAPC|nr:DUF4493 domain-containing protein [Flammeovirga pacifica]OHX64403.1 hypothetical protein NH26_22695 [Flammeovirga pacifica]